MNKIIITILFVTFLKLAAFSQSDFYRLYSDTLLSAATLKTIPTKDGGFIWLGDGISIIKADSNGIPLWSKDYSSNVNLQSGDIIELPNHDFIITGSCSIANWPTYLLMRIDSSGNLIYAKTDKDSSYVYNYWGDVNIAGLTSDNGFVFASRIRVDSLQQTFYPFISKIDSSGNCSWLKYFEVDTNTSCDKIRSLEDGNGNIIVAGCYRYYNLPNWREYFFIAKFDSSGILLWLKHGIQSSKINGMVNNIIELNGSYYVLTVQDTPTTFFNVPHIYKISASSGDLIWHTQYDFWLGWDENKIYRYNDGRLLFTCRDNISGLGMNAEIDTMGLILKSVRYNDGSYYLNIVNIIELNSGKGLITGFAGDGNSAWGNVFASIDSSLNTMCQSSDISLPLPVYYTDSMITKSHSVFTANDTLVDVTAAIHTNTRSLSYVNFCDVVNTTTLTNLQRLDIFPNPASSQFAVSSVQISNGTLEIFNLLGEKIYSTPYSESTTVNCELFPKGIYIVRLSDSEKQFNQKLVVE